MPSIRDNIISQIPSHIIEKYPNFVSFLEAYYEWMSQEGNPYHAIREHLSHLDFNNSIDDFISAMKNEYLVDTPDSILLDKELFIKWSKKFNSSRGSNQSYKFLFKLLYGEQNTEIYLPKENILKTSDGVWINNEFRMLITNSGGSIQDFELSRIVQERELFPNVFEYAYANVESVKNKYSGQYNLIELTISNIVGTFKDGYQINPEGKTKKEWLLPTIGSFNIESGGSGYQEGLEIKFSEELSPYKVTVEADKDGLVDSRVSGFFNESQLNVLINGTVLSDFRFDNRNITSSQILVGDIIQIEFPPYVGYMSIDSVSQKDIRSIINISILDSPIGISSDYYLKVSGQEAGSGFVGVANGGQYSSPIAGYYQGNKGQLSSNMYLQDNYYYQEYSYAVKTQKDIDDYGSIIKEIIHPAGFELFGYMQIIQIIQIIIGLVESEYTQIIPFKTESRSKYSLGANYSFFDKFKHGLSKRLYILSNFQDKSMTTGYVYNTSMGYPEYDSSYNLEDDTLSKTIIDGKSFVVNSDGWMTKHNLQDYFLYIPQNYSNEVESGITYFEQGYISEREEWLNNKIFLYTEASHNECYHNKWFKNQKWRLL